MPERDFSYQPAEKVSPQDYAWLYEHSPAEKEEIGSVETQALPPVPPQEPSPAQAQPAMSPFEKLWDEGIEPDESTVTSREGDMLVEEKPARNNKVRALAAMVLAPALLGGSMYVGYELNTDSETRPSATTITAVPSPTVTKTLIIQPTLSAITLRQRPSPRATPKPSPTILPSPSPTVVTPAEQQPPTAPAPPVSKTVAPPPAPTQAECVAALPAKVRVGQLTAAPVSSDSAHRLSSVFDRYSVGYAITGANAPTPADVKAFEGAQLVPVTFAKHSGAARFVVAASDMNEPTAIANLVLGKAEDLAHGNLSASSINSAVLSALRHKGVDACRLAS